MISNPEKCRPDGGPESALGGEREGGREGGPHRLRKEEGEGKRGQGESTGACFEKTEGNPDILSFLHPQIFTEGLLSALLSARLWGGRGKQKQ